MPIYYECQRCTACCRWPGDVNVDPDEITRLAAFLCMDENGFIQRYTHLRRNRQGLSLIEKPNGECIFLDGDDCMVQACKPKQCKDFPNRWNFPGFEKDCRAIPRHLTREQFDEKMKGG